MSTHTVQERLAQLGDYQDIYESILRLHAPRRYRSLFVSDLHLGDPHSRARAFLALLKHVEVDYLYLLGDIADFWYVGSKSVRKTGWSNPYHMAALAKILKRAAEGTNVILAPGNHDEDFSFFSALHLPHFLIDRQPVHEMADGRRFLLMHGHQFDRLLRDSFQKTLREHRWIGARSVSTFKWWAQTTQKGGGLLQSLGLAEKAPVRWAQYGMNGVLHGLRKAGFYEPFSLAEYIRDKTDGLSYCKAHMEAMRDFVYAHNIQTFLGKNPYYLDGVFAGHTHVAASGLYPPAIGPFGFPVGPAVVCGNTGHFSEPAKRAIAGSLDLQEDPLRPPCTFKAETEEGKIEHLRFVEGKGIVPFQPIVFSPSP